jgi:methylated-DNA-protein-cysteine methyltransferase-like protein
MKNFRSLPHDQQKNTQDFYARVYDLVRLIPPGKVCTYGIIAEFLGAKSSSRMVGWALNCVIDRIDIPCHRVVNRNGDLTGKLHFAYPEQMKELLLSENIQFIGESVDIHKHLWNPQEQDLIT